MYTFLHIIGARNRGFIRYISIRLSNPRYLYYDHEVVPGFAQIANEGNSLGDAFELLSSHHSLRTIVFFLEKSTVYQTGDLPSLLHHLLRPVQDSRLLQQLTKIRGGVKLSIRGLSKTELTVPEELQILCGTLKSLLSSPKESKSVPEELLRVEDGKHDIVQKVLGASKRYSDVVQRIEVAQKRIGEWEALKGQIEAAKEQVKSLTAEKQAIEKGFQDLQERAAVLPVLLD
ncbi:hypothetical protein MMC26_005051 [Xylographa opegraphella]|nr:hypothetical protein [Xylographa opegraphella]